MQWSEFFLTILCVWFIQFCQKFWKHFSVSSRWGSPKGWVTVLVPLMGGWGVAIIQPWPMVLGGCWQSLHIHHWKKGKGQRLDTGLYSGGKFFVVGLTINWIPSFIVSLYWTTNLKIDQQGQLKWQTLTTENSHGLFLLSGSPLPPTLAKWESSCKWTS